VTVGRWAPLAGSGTVIGMDAGGSGTRAVVVRDGVVVSRPTEGPANALLHPDAVERLAALVRASGADLAGLGLPGVRTVAQADELAGRLNELTGRAVTVSDDAETALLGAFGGAPGIIVIAGTGSVAYGWDGERCARAGGHGYLLGDEGGGYWLGREAVRASLAARDRIGPRTLLCRDVEAAFGSLDAAVATVHSRPTDRGLLAGLATAVSRAAVAEDPVAVDIVGRAAAVLAGLVEAVQERLGPLPACGVGRVLADTPVAEALASRIELTAAAGPPELGAALLAVRGRLGMVTG